jgi:hypothetical protein
VNSPISGSITRGLDKTLPRGRSTETPVVTTQKRLGAVNGRGLGDGSVQEAPGTSVLRNGERSAKHYGDALQRRYGGNST